jgi:hypothetical protein
MHHAEKDLLQWCITPLHTPLHEPIPRFIAVFSVAQHLSTKPVKALVHQLVPVYSNASS